MDIKWGEVLSADKISRVAGKPKGEPIAKKDIDMKKVNRLVKALKAKMGAK